MWRLNDPQSNEAAKVKYDIVPYTRGKGLDLGCGPFKAYPHFIGVDNGHHWGTQGADVAVDTCEKLELFASSSMDFVFSSHLLEHIVDTGRALKEWFRVLKPGGHLVLYLPHKDLYPNIGEEGANPDHKHDFLPKDIIQHMKKLHDGWDLVLDEVRDHDNGEGKPGNEYSFLQVYRKRKDNKHIVQQKGSKPEKTVCVVRYGAFGDLIQTSSLFPQLKEQGYHVTLMTTPHGYEVVKHDPYIDEVILQDKDQVPNVELRHFWEVWAKKFDKFINLSESVEGSLLTMQKYMSYNWPHEARHAMLDHNYLEMMHAIAQVPFKPWPKFYPTEQEEQWANGIIKQFQGDPTVMVVLSGSSVHKTTHYLDQIIAQLLLSRGDLQVITVGGNAEMSLEMGWENEPRVHTRSGKMSIRETMALAQKVNVVFGPETGVLNAVSMEDVTKVVYLSHSSIKNLTRDWVHTVSLTPEGCECYPCHKMHYGWDTCKQTLAEVTCKGPTGELETGKVPMADCVSKILPDRIVKTILKQLPPSKVVNIARTG